MHLISAVKSLQHGRICPPFFDHMSPQATSPARVALSSISSPVPARRLPRSASWPETSDQFGSTKRTPRRADPPQPAGLRRPSPACVSSSACLPPATSSSSRRVSPRWSRTFVILVAEDLASEPAAVVKLLCRVPPGLHGNWYPAGFAVLGGSGCNRTRVVAPHAASAARRSRAANRHVGPTRPEQLLVGAQKNSFPYSPSTSARRFTSSSRFFRGSLSRFCWRHLTAGSAAASGTLRSGHSGVPRLNDIRNTR